MTSDFLIQIISLLMNIMQT